MSVYKYEARFDGKELEAVGTIEAEGAIEAGDILRGMCGEWQTKDGQPFNAGCPTDFVLWEDK